MATMEDFIANSSDEAHRQSYFSLSTGNGLDSPNLTASLGNPLKGLMGSPWYYNYMFDSSVPESLEWFYIGWNTLMKGDPDVVGPDLAFDWTELEIRLNETASRYNHAVFTVFAHYPSWEVPLAIPQYLIDAGLPLYEFPELYGSNLSPDYGDPMMLRALEQFITALGAQYDGDTRIGFIHLGLLGFWVR